MYKVVNLKSIEMEYNKTIKNLDGVTFPYTLCNIEFSSCAVEDISEIFKYNMYVGITFRDCTNLDVDYNQFCTWRREGMTDSINAGQKVIDFANTKFEKKMNRDIKFKNPIDKKIVHLAYKRQILNEEVSFDGYMTSLAKDKVKAEKEQNQIFGEKIVASQFLNQNKIILIEKDFTSEEEKYQVLNRLINETPELSQAIDLRRVKVDLDTLISKGIVKPNSLNHVILQNTQAVKQTYIMGDAESMKGLKIKFQSLNQYGVISDKNEEMIMQAICQGEAKKCFEAIKKDNPSEILRALAAINITITNKQSWLSEITYFTKSHTQEQLREATIKADKYLMTVANDFFNMAGIEVIDVTDRGITFICDGKEGSFNIGEKYMNYPGLTESDIKMDLMPGHVNKHLRKYYEKKLDRVEMIISRYDSIYKPEILDIKYHTGSEDKLTIEETRAYYKEKLEEAKLGVDKVSKLDAGDELFAQQDSDTFEQLCNNDEIETDEEVVEAVI